MKFAVIGAGSMGRGIAQVMAQSGATVFLIDKFEKAIDTAKAHHEKIFSRLVEKGKWAEEQKSSITSRIIYQNDYSGVEDCSFIIEAIIENVEIKKSLFQELEAIVNKDCVLASNTSSLSIASLGAALKKPDRCIGIHFFNPAPLMKLVEIIPAIQTSEATLKATSELVKNWGKITVLAKDTPGFIVNRVARPFYGEALRMYEEGFANPATIDYAMTEIGGFRMGPFTLMDYIGNDINYIVTETVFKSFYYDARYKPSFTQKRLSEAGYLGRKTGRGYYDYSPDAAPKEINKDETLLNNIFWRILAMLINEAADALYLNIASKEDIDLAMTKGVNYPKGLLAWADEKGIAHCVDTLDGLFDEYHEERYRCSPLLRKMKRENLKFFDNDEA